MAWVYEKSRKNHLAASRTACTPEEKKLQNAARRRITGNLCNKCGIGQRAWNMTICRECNKERLRETSKHRYLVYHRHQIEKKFRQRWGDYEGSCVRCRIKMDVPYREFPKKIDARGRLASTGWLLPRFFCKKCYERIWDIYRETGEFARSQINRLLWEFRIEKGLILPTTPQPEQWFSKKWLKRHAK